MLLIGSTFCYICNSYLVLHHIKIAQPNLMNHIKIAHPNLIYHNQEKDYIKIFSNKTHIKFISYFEKKCLNAVYEKRTTNYIKYQLRSAFCAC